MAVEDFLNRLKVPYGCHVSIDCPNHDGGFVYCSYSTLKADFRDVFPADGGRLSARKHFLALTHPLLRLGGHSLLQQSHASPVLLVWAYVTREIGC